MCSTYGSLRSIVIDTGSSLCKAGFAGDDDPQVVFPCIVGRPKHVVVYPGMDRPTFVGNTAQKKRGILTLRYPIEKGVINNWEDMELIWHFIFYHELNINPHNHPVLTSRPPLSTSVYRENISQIMFEKFGVPSLFLSPESVMSLVTVGKTTGLVVECGSSVSHITPVMDGCEITKAAMHLNIAGHSLTDYLTLLLTQRGHRFTTTAEREIVREMKEKLCYVAQNIDEECKRNLADIQKTYLLPDGQTITLDHELYRCPEPLFSPALIGDESFGLPEFIKASINKTDMNPRVLDEFYSNIVLSGGSTLFNGMHGRLVKEVNALSIRKKANIIFPERRQFAVWRGGSVLACLSSLKSKWITKQQFEEHGPSIFT